jgi:hypothetical protein
LEYNVFEITLVLFFSHSRGRPAVPGSTLS